MHTMTSDFPAANSWNFCHTPSRVMSYISITGINRSNLIRQPAVTGRIVVMGQAKRMAVGDNRCMITGSAISKLLLKITAKNIAKHAS
ncbi:MAG: hypothetical protein HN350_16905 [Phycisphaerales bacterium]|jgi:hypothetical protein|nr:hypothetical protein [Phycisphaerales bacterium]